MRHGKKVNHLGRTASHRKAMLSNMASSLILHKRINTTVAKAKALRTFVEPLLTKSKEDTTHNRRTVFSYLQNKDVVSELFRTVAPKIADRPGGYTRIIRTGYRLGDNAEMCLIELVDFNEIYTNETAKKTTRRSRRGGSGAGKAEATATEEVSDSTEVSSENTDSTEVSSENTDSTEVSSENTDSTEVSSENEETAVAEEVETVVEVSTEEVVDSTEDSSEDTDSAEASSEDEDKE